MATFQGERYVEQQIRSILAQMSPVDELIVVDDASTDSTCELVSTINDPRLTLLRNRHNQGVSSTFSRALSSASGSIVFLSDQDDLWLPDKLSTCLSAFDSDPALMLVASDAILIDEADTKVGDSYYAVRGEFRDDIWSNLLKCKFLGCTMAFRLALVERALPFPATRWVHHDIWLGCVNALSKGKTRYIRQPLVAYRRHSTNVTGRIKFSWARRFRMRWLLLLHLLRFCLRVDVRNSQTD